MVFGFVDYVQPTFGSELRVKVLGTGHLTMEKAGREQTSHFTLHDEIPVTNPLTIGTFCGKKGNNVQSCGFLRQAA